MALRVVVVVVEDTVVVCGAVDVVVVVCGCGFDVDGVVVGGVAVGGVAAGGCGCGGDVVDAHDVGVVAYNADSFGNVVLFITVYSLQGVRCAVYYNCVKFTAIAVQRAKLLFDRNSGFILKYTNLSRTAMEVQRAKLLFD